MAESNRRFFKGWAKPGPLLPHDPSSYACADSEIAAGLRDGTVTLDAISGDYRLFQYREGHRFSTDDVLVAAWGPSWAPRAETVLDLGSGIGSVGMMAAWRLPLARFVTVEAQDISVKLAREARRYNQLEGRYDIRQGDFRDAGVLAPDEAFDLVLGSPPYFPLGTGVLGDHPQKIACRFEVRGSIVDYCATAAAHLAPGGWFAAVFPQIQRERVVDAARDAGLRIVRSREVVLREGEPPLLELFAMVRDGDLPATGFDTWREPPLLIRDKAGQVHPEYRVFKLSVGFPPV